MNPIYYLQRLHKLFSAEIGAALDKNSEDHAYLCILLFAQLSSIAALFITEGPAGHYILVYFLLPTLFLPLRFTFSHVAGLKVPVPAKFSLYNLFRNTILCRTPLFLAVLIYSANKAYLSYLYPEAILGYLHIFFYYLLAPLLAFMVATIRLSVDLTNFYFLFFRLITPIVALNASINIYQFCKAAPDLYSLGLTRMASSFGAAMGYNPNLDALIYAVFFVGLILTINSHTIKYNFLSSFPSLLILFCAILLEQSRASSLAIIISLLIYALNQRSKLDSGVIYASISALIIFLIFVAVFLPGGISSYISRPDHLRVELWLKFFNIIRENSYFGLGDRIIFAVPLTNGELAPHPHNILYSSLLRGGVIGFCSMIFIIIRGLKIGFHYARRRQNPVPVYVFLMVMIAGIFDFDLKVWQAGWYLAGYWLAIALVTGADAALTNDSHPKSHSCAKSDIFTH